MGVIHESLKAKTLEVIAPCMPDDMNDVCIVDPPDHSNVGDSAIFSGETDFLRRNYRSASLWFFDKKNYTNAHYKFIENSTLLAFHGGGNFGDIWPGPHKLRLQILEQFPEIPKIQFPQSISFAKDGLLERTQRAIEKQKNYTLFVRDTLSLSFAQKHFECNTYLCPDMAFSLRPIKRLPSEFDYFCLLRTDREKKLEKSDLIKDVMNQHALSYRINDWTDWQKTYWPSMEGAIRRLNGYYPDTTGLTRPISFSFREKFAWSRIHYGIKLLSSGKRVVTDRLHGHIISTLLEIEHFAFDSLDGKVSAFHKTWLGDDQNVKFLSSMEQLSDQLESWRDSATR